MSLGETVDGTPVAIKLTAVYDLESYTQELECYNKMNATMDKVCEKYGIPFIYHSGEFLGYKTIAMTILGGLDLYWLRAEFGSFSKDSILIIFRDMVG